MSAAVVVAVVISFVALLAIATVVYFSVPRRVTLLLTSDSYLDDTVTVEIARRKSNGKFDYNRDDRRKIRFRGRTREVRFDGLVPDAWYRVETFSKSNETRMLLKTGSCVEIRIDNVCKVMK
jgi:hypothetical protein